MDENVQDEVAATAPSSEEATASIAQKAPSVAASQSNPASPEHEISTLPPPALGSRRFKPLPTDLSGSTADSPSPLSLSGLGNMMPQRATLDVPELPETEARRRVVIVPQPVEQERICDPGPGAGLLSQPAHAADVPCNLSAGASTAGSTEASERCTPPPTDRSHLPVSGAESTMSQEAMLDVEAPQSGEEPELVEIHRRTILYVPQLSVLKEQVSDPGLSSQPDPDGVQLAGALPAAADTASVDAASAVSKEPDASLDGRSTDGHDGSDSCKGTRTQAPDRSPTLDHTLGLDSLSKVEKSSSENQGEDSVLAPPSPRGSPVFRSPTLENDEVMAAARTFRIGALFPPGEKFENVYECVKNSGLSKLNAELERVSYDDLLQRTYRPLDTFHNAHVVVVDLTDRSQRNNLIFFLGNRESTRDKDELSSKSNGRNILLFSSENDEEIFEIKRRCPAKQPHTFLSYRSVGGKLVTPDFDSTLTDLRVALYSLFCDVQKDERSMFKEVYIKEINTVTANNKEEALEKAMQELRERMEVDKRLYTSNIVHQWLIAYQSVKAYQEMIKMYESLPDDPQLRIAPVIYLYCFALVRRNIDDDCDKAIKLLLELLEDKDNHTPDILGQCGRIYKIKFVASGHTDQTALKNAIYWYQRGFDIKPNIYAGVNLATLLVVNGVQFKESSYVQGICMMIQSDIGTRGQLHTLKDYWEVATLFELHILAENYLLAATVAERMFHLKPTPWKLQTTRDNIRLINTHRDKDVDMTPMGFDKELIDFWLLFFDAAANPTFDNTTVPVVSMIPRKQTRYDQGDDFSILPCFITVNEVEEADQLMIHIYHACYRTTTDARTDFQILASSVCRVSLSHSDDRCMVVFVREDAQDFRLFFPGKKMREIAFDRIKRVLLKVGVEALDDAQEAPKLQIDYVMNDSGVKKELGSGSFGRVYLGENSVTKERVAIKEVEMEVHSTSDTLQEEIRLHSHLHHSNIVKYYGSEIEKNVFRIYMEYVPGGSLGKLLQVFGPLITHPQTVARYTRHILAGIAYLHKHKVIHRDIKGDNVLINTYTDVVKIGDFGTAKRLSCLNPRMRSMKGTMQFMAPEVVNNEQDQNGYGRQADIWSLGCTVVEMLQGKVPFQELGSGEAALFQVGMYGSHPKIPAGAEPNCVEFLLRCFATTAAERATSDQLLEDVYVQGPFPSATHWMSGPLVVPAFAATPPIGGSLTSPQRSPNTGRTIPGFYRSSPSYSTQVSLPIPSPTTPDVGTRRSISLSGDGQYSIEAIYAGRRAFLIQAMRSQSAKIVDLWLERQEAAPASSDVALLLQEDFATLHKLFRYCVQEKDEDVLQATAAPLLSQMEKPGFQTAVKLAIPEAPSVVKTILKLDRRIQPNEFFTMNTVLSGAIVRAFNSFGDVFRPQVKRRSLESPADIPVPDEALDSGESTPDGGGSPEVSVGDPAVPASSDPVCNVTVQHLTSVLDNLCNSIASVKSNISSLTASEQKRSSAKASFYDKELNTWLSSEGMSQEVVDAFAHQQLTFADVIYHVTLENLVEMGLKIGPRGRIWRLIQALRAKENEPKEVVLESASN